jgi:hypothetical protein
LTGSSNSTATALSYLLSAVIEVRTLNIWAWQKGKVAGPYSLCGVDGGHTAMVLQNRKLEVKSYLPHLAT